MFFLGKALKKILVFVIDELGRNLTKESMHRLIEELFNEALDERNIDAVVVNGPSVNTCSYLTGMVSGLDIDEWELIYFHGSKYPPVLLNYSNKETLATMLPGFKGTSAEAVFKVLTDSGTFNRFQ